METTLLIPDKEEGERIGQVTMKDISGGGVGGGEEGTTNSKSSNLFIRRRMKVIVGRRVIVGRTILKKLHTTLSLKCKIYFISVVLIKAERILIEKHFKKKQLFF